MEQHDGTIADADQAIISTDDNYILGKPKHSESKIMKAETERSSATEGRSGITMYCISCSHEPGTTAEKKENYPDLVQ